MSREDLGRFTLKESINEAAVAVEPARVEDEISIGKTSPQLDKDANAATLNTDVSISEAEAAATEKPMDDSIDLRRLPPVSEAEEMTRKKLRRNFLGNKDNDVKNGGNLSGVMKNDANECPSSSSGIENGNRPSRGYLASGGSAIPLDEVLEECSGKKCLVM